MINRFDKGMDDAYLGKEITDKDPSLEYLQGYEYAESLLYPAKQFPEQRDDRVQPDDRVQEWGGD